MSVTWSVTVHGDTLEAIRQDGVELASAFFGEPIPVDVLDVDVTGFISDMAGNIYSYEARVSITRP